MLQCLKNIMKVCIFGDRDCYHSETLVDLFKKNHNVMLFVNSIGIARELMSSNNDIKITYNPVDIEGQDVFIICNETSFDNITQKVNITNIVNTIEIIKRYGRKGCTVIIESTVGVGTTRKYFGNSDMHAAYSPSRFDSSNICIMPKDIPKLIGGIDDESERLVMQLYSTVFNVIVRTGTCEVAEGAALLEKAAKIVQKAFLNEFSDFCERIKLDVHHVIDAAGTCMNNKLTTSPWIGKSTNDMSARHLIYHEEDWPVLHSAVQQLEKRPKLIYEKIVEHYCGKKNYDELHKKCFLMVGLGEQIGSTSTKNSPVMEIIKDLEIEGAVVIKYDMFIDEYSQVPTMEHNSGLPRFDGIIVMHPYLVSKWESYSYTTFLCRN